MAKSPATIDAHKPVEANVLQFVTQYDAGELEAKDYLETNCTQIPGCVINESNLNYK